MCLHYLLNLLQPLSFTQPVVVSLNPVRDIARKHIMGEYDYPTYVLMLPMRSLHRHGSGALAHNRRGLLSFHDRAASAGRRAAELSGAPGRPYQHPGGLVQGIV
ncbi:MAG: hypothetical protein Q8R56_11910 [Polaromonas sp.]|nr:hypothetical protein [Polaromonas sp.]